MGKQYKHYNTFILNSSYIQINDVKSSQRRHVSIYRRKWQCTYTYLLLLPLFMMLVTLWCKFVDCDVPCMAAAAADDACKFCVCKLSELSGCDGWFCRLCVVGIDSGWDSDSPGSDSDGIRSIIMLDDLPIERIMHQYLVDFMYESVNDSITRLSM